MPAVEANGHVNGQMTQDTITALLEEPLTEGYTPSLPLWASYLTDTLPQIWLLRDLELMMIHPIVSNALEYFKSGIAGAEFWGGPNLQDPNDPIGRPICADSPEVDQFVRDQCTVYWDRGVPQLQGGYEYGWIGAENIYENDGVLKWKNLLHFAPRDTFPLTMDQEFVGVRIKGIKKSGKGAVDLWSATEDVPAKGLWYAH